MFVVVQAFASLCQAHIFLSKTLFWKYDFLRFFFLFPFFFEEWWRLLKSESSNYAHFRWKVFTFANEIVNLCAAIWYIKWVRSIRVRYCPPTLMRAKEFLFSAMAFLKSKHKTPKLKENNGGKKNEKKFPLKRPPFSTSIQLCPRTAICFLSLFFSLALTFLYCVPNEFCYCCYFFFIF